MDNQIKINIKGDISEYTIENVLKPEFNLKLSTLKKYLSDNDIIEVFAKYKESIKVPDIILSINTNGNNINIKTSGKDSLNNAILKAKTILKKEHSKKCDKQTFTTRKVEMFSENNINSKAVTTENCSNTIIKHIFELIEAEEKLKMINRSSKYERISNNFYEESYKFEQAKNHFEVLNNIYRTEIYSLDDKEKLLKSMADIKNDMKVSLSNMRKLVKRIKILEKRNEVYNTEKNILSLKNNTNVK